MPSNMSHSTAITFPPIPSAQLDANGQPRFHLPVNGFSGDVELLAAAESEGGVQAEFRALLDAQLENSDVLIDLSPGAGFLALSAATVPGVAARVCAVVSSSGEARRIESAAHEACAAIECVIVERHESLVDRFSEALSQLPFGARLFVHVAPAQATEPVLAALETALQAGVVAAVLLSPRDQTGENAWERACLSLNNLGCAPHLLAERDGELALFLATEVQPTDMVIAIPQEVCGASAESESGTPEVYEEAPSVDEIFPHPVAWPRTDTALNLIAPFQRTGYGIAGAYLLNALQQLGAKVHFFPMGAVDRSLIPVPGLDDALNAQASFDAAAPSVRLAQQFDLALHVGRGARVGFPIFESTQFTAHERHHLNTQDRLLVCSEWARGVMYANGILHTPIHVVPLGVDRRVFHEGLVAKPARKETVFLQVGKLELRKGQVDLLRAFEAAFRPGDAVRLVLACHNPFLSPEQFEHLARPFKTSPMAKHITLITTPLPTHDHVAELMASADCGVFCSRGEGWNLEALEMLSVGKPIIATAYSAHTAFLTPANARLVSIDALEPTGTVGHWAAFGAAQHAQLVEHLRDVHVERQSGPLPVNHAGIQTACEHSWTASATALLAAIT